MTTPADSGAPPSAPPKVREAVPAALMDRASELACSGDYDYLYQIERQLIAEGHAKVAVLGKSAEHKAILRGLLATTRSRGQGKR